MEPWGCDSGAVTVGPWDSGVIISFLKDYLMGASCSTFLH